MDNISFAIESLLSHTEEGLERRMLAYWALHKQFKEGFHTDTDLSLKFREERWKGEPGTKIRWLVKRVTEDNGVERSVLATKIVELTALTA